MTALQRAEAIVRKHSRKKRPALVDAIHRACIEHSNAELERKREALAEVARLKAELAAARTAGAVEELRRLACEWAEWKTRPVMVWDLRDRADQLEGKNG